MLLDLAQHAFPVLMRGLATTLLLVMVAVPSGFILGLALALVRCDGHPALAEGARIYSLIFRGTPLLVQLFLIYFGLGQVAYFKEVDILWWVLSDGAHCTILALTLNTAAYTSEILLGGLRSLPKGLVEAAEAIGMSRWLRFMRIDFPLAIRQALPSYGNEVILVVKATSLASTVTVMEITGYAKRLMSQTYAIIEIFAFAGMLYLVINMLLIVLFRLIESRLMRHTAQAR
jgi:octopine/nopaline transport system permease protein